LLFTLAVLLPATLGMAADESKQGNGHGHRPPEAGGNTFNVTVPAHPFDLIMARPEKDCISLSVLAYQDLEGSVAWGTQPGVYQKQTPIQQFKKNEPVEIRLNGLNENTQYYYQFRSRQPGSQAFASGIECAFHTARSQGSTFTFTMTADVHLDEHTSPDIYMQSLANIRADHPDFHIDIGNLFMTDKHATRDEAEAQYLAQRYYLGQIGGSSPVLLALGVHDGESSRYIDGSTASLAVWSHQIRTRYFPNPVRDKFYTGNTDPKAPLGSFQNYYAWTWGDALFVVLDPFRYSSPSNRGGDGWGWSLGLTQYHWLKQTLEQSKAKYKFVFIHNLLCGDQAARGGVEVAGLNEWGGKNADGSDGFKEHRPGWEMPVHQLLVRNYVTAVFKAHDNFYARQELDGIVYQMIPQPSFAGNDRIRDLENYGYKQGVFLGNSGHVRVTVSPEKVTVDYVHARLPKDESGEHKNGEIAHSYVIPFKAGLK